MNDSCESSTTFGGNLDENPISIYLVKYGTQNLAVNKN